MKASLGVLKIFVSESCRGCKRAVELAAWLRKITPHLRVQIEDIALGGAGKDGLVFAVPTYVYDNRPLFLGNPSKQEKWLDKLEV